MANKNRLDNLNNRFDNELINMINQLVPYEKPAGDYVWKKLSTEGGELIDYVVSNDPSAYPDRGYQGQYWYELFKAEGQYVWGKYEIGLPSGYTALNYIKATGTQYINTHFKPNDSTRVVMEFEAETSDVMWFFGSRHDAFVNTFALVQLNATQVRNDHYTTQTPHGVDNTNKKNFIDRNGNILNFGSVTITNTQGNFQCNYDLTLLAVNTAGTVETDTIAKGKLYSAEVYDDGVLIRKYIPCRNPNGEIGMYDLVNFEFEPNSGTGVFTAGAESSVVIKGSFVDYLVSDDKNAYPSDDELNGYWYTSLSDTANAKLKVYEYAVSVTNSNQFSVANPFEKVKNTMFALAFRHGTTSDPILFLGVPKVVSLRSASNSISASRTVEDNVEITDKTITFNKCSKYVAGTWELWIGGLE